MSSSTHKTRANRRNAQLSTGPRTEEGKLASSQNAVKTGLTSSKMFVRPDEHAEFEQFQTNLVAELKPAGEFQHHVFRQLVHAAWNIRRCLALEIEIQNEAIERALPDAILDDQLARKLDRVYRYKRMHETAQRRAVADLRLLQNEAMLRRVSPEPLDETASVLVQSPKRPVAKPPMDIEKYLTPLVTLPDRSANVDI